MNIFLLIEGAALFTLIGFNVGFLVFKHRFYKPLQKQHDEALKGWKQAIETAFEIAALSEEHDHVPTTKNGEKMILSPLQVKRFGQPD